jgi:hypothetical protein
VYLEHSIAGKMTEFEATNWCHRGRKGVKGEYMVKDYSTKRKKPATSLHCISSLPTSLKYTDFPLSLIKHAFDSFPANIVDFL